MAELVAGALLSSFLNVLFDRMTTPEFLHLFKTRKMNQALLKELESLLHVVNGVLDDAEDRQLASPTLGVQKFLDDLRDAAYEADDLLDDINYEVTAANIQAEDSSIDTANQSWNKCCLHYPFEKLSKKRESFPADVPERMQKIVNRLRSLVNLSSKLELKNNNTSGRKEVSPPRQTSSLVKQSDIIGRDAEMNDILNLLKDDGAAIGVIPIVGMGGIGKTTMAQLVFNESRVQNMFECRAWVCVSDNYDMLKIKKQLFNHVNDLVGNDDMTLDQIDRKLQESLKGKKYLLVLDDLWNDNYTDWETLLAPLKSGAQGSKIIITTRNQKIAAKMGTVAKSHKLGELDANSCWQLFANRAFKDGEGDRKFQAIGKEIVSKCGGLPLAAIMLGGLLRGETEETKWEAVRDSNIWELSNNNPLAALRLSYQHLPSYLKQCFVYCAIFPKDYEMKKEQIIQLWMAEGFLAIGGKKMEDFGRECFDELVSRSFFQECIQYDGEPCFLMHDLINDLAKLICGEFLIRMDDDNSCKFSARNRYFSFIWSEANIWNTLTLDGTCKAQFLRSLLSCCKDYMKVDDAVVNDLISHLRCLRVLSLQGFRTVVNLPKAIGNLKHMRYLDLKGTSLTKLPESVCTLYNLQTVILCRCYKLVELPREFGNLINLHFLDLSDTPNLQEMPPKMGNLKNLRALSKFSVGKQNCSNINELAKLQHLRKLHIFNLQNVVGTPKDILKNKMHLEHLELDWSGEIEDSEHEKSFLEGLKPYESIITLSISGYGGKNFPNWIGDSFYTNIVSLKLTDCKNCTDVPPLEQLSSLKHLAISKFDAVEELCMKMPLNSLETLRIEDMKRWQKWIFGEENDRAKRGSLAKLEELRIKNCPELKCISRCGPTHMIFESLNSLMVEAGRKACYFNEIPKVKLEQLPSAMYGLHINKLRVEGLEEMCSALQAVRIRKSESVECIPLEVFPVLKSLDVHSCINKLMISQWRDGGFSSLLPLISWSCDC